MFDLLSKSVFYKICLEFGNFAKNWTIFPNCKSRDKIPHHNHLNYVFIRISVIISLIWRTNNIMPLLWLHTDDNLFNTNNKSQRYRCQTCQRTFRILHRDQLPNLQLGRFGLRFVWKGLDVRHKSISLWLLQAAG